MSDQRPRPTVTETALCCMMVSNPSGLVRPPDWQRRVNDHMRAQRDRIAALEAALEEAARFMAYFAGETGGSFAGPGTPQSCLAAIRAAIEAKE